MTRWLVAFVGLCACATSSNGGSPGDDDDDGGAGVRPDARAGDGDSGPTACGSLHATVRDFRASHPDFETFQGSAAFPGIVKPMLDGAGKPEYAHSGATAQTTGPTEFGQWYDDVPGVNQAFSIEIPLSEQAPGVFVYDSNAFFPVDQLGFGDEGNAHNFHFTTEIHTQFRYEGGESFTFSGDDDLWLFINHRLAIDLGGLHPALSQTVDFDARAGELGLELGHTYPMEIFHAERHTPESNFRVETTVDCFVVP